MVASRAQARLAGNHSPPPRPTGPRTRSAAVRTGVVWGESGTGPPRWGKGGSGPSGGVKDVGVAGGDHKITVMAI